MRMMTMLLVFLFLCAAGCATRVVMDKRDRAWMSADGVDFRISHAELPLSVWVDPKVDPRWWPELRHGIRAINQIVGAEIFRDPILAPSKMKFDQGMEGVVFVQAVPDGNPNTSFALRRIEGDDLATIASARIRLPPSKGPFADVLRLVVLHELGHALGLDHDPDLRSSIMHPTIGHRPQDFTDADRARLRARYTTP